MDYNIIQGACTLTNSGDNFVGTLPINIPSYVNNGLYLVRVPINNTTATPTLNLNGLGAVTITTNTGAPLAIGQILDSGWYLLMYSSSNRFLLISSTGNVLKIGTATYTPNTTIGTSRETTTFTVNGAVTTDRVIANINDSMRADFVSSVSYFLDMQAYVSAPNTVTLTYILNASTTFGVNSSINLFVQRG